MSELLDVVLAVVAYMAIGGLWYSPLLFQKQWLRSLGITTPEAAAEFQKGSVKPMAGAVVIGFVIAFALNYFLSLFPAPRVIDGVHVGLSAGIGFMATIAATVALFEKRSRTAYFINVGYHVVALAVMGAILAAWS